MNVKPGFLEDSLVVMSGLRKTLTEGESQVWINVSSCLVNKCVRSLFTVDDQVYICVVPSFLMSSLITSHLFIDEEI